MQFDPFKQHRYKTYKVLGYSTSEKEINDLIKAWIIISLAFAFILGTRNFMSIEFYKNLLIAAVAVGTGFVFHELGHKIVAQKYGCFAEFRANMGMLFFALFLAFVGGFVFAAPGAVMISGYVNRTINGKISIAGPLTNLVLSIVFLALSIWVNILGLSFLAAIFMYGFLINTWLGLFNLIPIGNFDGIKILRWNKLYYGLMVVFGLLLFSMQWFLRIIAQ